MTREELGRCTWTLLHTLAAQYAEQPTKQQQRDARELVRATSAWAVPCSQVAQQILILTRLYPCRECAVHFAELVRSAPHVPQLSGFWLSLQNVQRGPPHSCFACRAVAVVVPYAQQSECSARQARLQLCACRGALGARRVQGRCLHNGAACDFMTKPCALVPACAAFTADVQMPKRASWQQQLCSAVGTEAPSKVAS